MPMTAATTAVFAMPTPMSAATTAAFAMPMTMSAAATAAFAMPMTAATTGFFLRFVVLFAHFSSSR